MDECNAYIKYTRENISTDKVLQTTQIFHISIKHVWHQVYFEVRNFQIVTDVQVRDLNTKHKICYFSFPKSAGPMKMDSLMHFLHDYTEHQWQLDTLLSN